MDGKNEVTTEVQIRRNHFHLSHLRKVVSCTAGWLGMSCKRIEETENAVSEICSSSLDVARDCQDENLTVRLSTHGTFMVVEITDPSASQASGSSEQRTRDYSDALQRIDGLVDSVEFAGTDDGTTIRIVKHAGEQEPAPARKTPYVPALGTTASQS